MKRPLIHRHDGFTLMELLVTMILASIIFVAMIPVFVGAQQTNVNDAMRNTAAALAQDKIERVRQLAYSDITLTHLQSATWDGSQFGTQATVNSGGGKTRTMSIAYNLTYFPTGMTGIAQQYVIVSVTVTWTAPPTPKPITLTAIVYKQYAGPPITYFALSPVPDSSNSITNPASITLFATVDPGWITTTSQVVFQINDANGHTVAGQTVKVTDTDTLKAYHYDGNGVYEWKWTGASTAAGGLYSFTATAFGGATSSSAGYAGPTASEPANLIVTTPPMVTGLAATAGHGQVLLVWNASTATGVINYEIWRSTVAGNLGSIIASPAAGTTSYVDSPLVNGTTYYYSIDVVNDVNSIIATSSPCPQVVATPTPPPPPNDTTAPTVPNGLTVTNAKGTLANTLHWTPSVDNPPPATPSGVAGYYICRNTTGSFGAQPYQTQLLGSWTNLVPNPESYTDAAIAWNTPYWYCVQAYDASGNVSGPSNIFPAPAISWNTCNLIVENDNKSVNASVWVYNSVTGKYYTTAGVPSSTPPPATSVQKNGKTTTFTGVPQLAGYTIYVNYSGSGFVTTDPYGPFDLSTAGATEKIST
jgi:prepilin-type N-terminal cleavage/methylation domain-containing protein